MGPEFLGALQTKDLESLMDTYWLSTDGLLYRIDDSEAYDLEPIEESERSWWGPRFRTKPSGKRGKVRPYRKSGVVRFTVEHDGQYLEAVVHFKYGELSSVLCSGPIFSCNRVDD
jgi:hypothetical protein